MGCDSILSWIVIMAVTLIGFCMVFAAATKRDGFRQVESDKIEPMYRGF